MINGTMNQPIECRPPVGAGRWALRMQPSGARTSMGSSVPMLLGTVGVVSDLIA